MQELLANDQNYQRIAVNPNGEYAAFYEYSFCREEWKRSGQRIGWIDYIGTQPEHPYQGLGSALLFRSLHHLETQGAVTAKLVTVSTHTPAIGLYLKVGFSPINAPKHPSYQISISPK